MGRMQLCPRPAPLTADRLSDIAELRRAPLERYCGIAQHRVFIAGYCAWCGRRIELVDPTDYRRRSRSRHRGDRHELAFDVGGRVKKRNCRRLHNLSVIYGARDLIKFRGDPCCADCGRVDGLWDADHRVALIDGGPHCPTNIERRCKDCHRTKTREEARARAAGEPSRYFQSLEALGVGLELGVG